MQSVNSDLDSFGEDWASLQFDLELTRSTPPPSSHLTPQLRLGSAALPNQRPISDLSHITMASSSTQAYGPSSSYDSADVEEIKQETTPPRDQHRRGYQACDPCRKRKVKCDLGSMLVYPCNSPMLTL
jgi:Fungal Zn(2)-Cys(6) binuclear cluster domain